MNFLDIGKMIVCEKVGKLYGKYCVETSHIISYDFLNSLCSYLHGSATGSLPGFVSHGFRYQSNHGYACTCKAFKTNDHLFFCIAKREQYITNHGKKNESGG